MKNKQDKGFTLVELLIVIVILGILATITVFAVRGITDKGKENSCAVEKTTILTAVEAYYAQEGSEPLTLDVLANGAYVNDTPDELNATWTFVPATVVDGDVTAPADLEPVTDAGAKCATFSG